MKLSENLYNLIGSFFYKQTLNYTETQVMQGKSVETSNKCAGLVDLKAIKHLEGNEFFNPFNKKEDKEKASQLQKMHESTNYPNGCFTYSKIHQTDPDVLDGQENQLVISKLLMRDMGFVNDPGFHKTNRVKETKEFFKAIEKKTEADHLPRAVITAHEIFYDEQTKYSESHVSFFGTQYKNGKISCSGMDSNAIVNYGEGAEGCSQVMDRLEYIYNQYPQPHKSRKSDVHIVCGVKLSQ